MAFENGSGVNADVDVWQEVNDSAWPITLALAKGVGCTRAGAFHTSFVTETDLDLFSEQGLWPAFFECLMTSYELLVEKGYPPEAVALELYASAEAADIFLAMAKARDLRANALSLTDLAVWSAIPPARLYWIERSSPQADGRNANQDSEW